MATICLTGECECNYLIHNEDKNKYYCVKDEDEPIETTYNTCIGCSKLDIYEMFFDGSYGE